MLIYKSPRRKGKRVSSVMEGGQEVLKRESMGRRFKGELRDLVERIHSTEVCNTTPLPAHFTKAGWLHDREQVFWLVQVCSRTVCV